VFTALEVTSSGTWLLLCSSAAACCAFAFMARVVRPEVSIPCLGAAACAEEEEVLVCLLEDMVLFVECRFVESKEVGRLASRRVAR
jgi:hypothetical protein